MKIWFDTEFIEDGRTIDLISIGLVREDGAELYLESSECDLTRADAWVTEHVISQLDRTLPTFGAAQRIVTRETIARQVLAFAGNSPEFWAYYADYDWVSLCQLYGRMIDLPKGWPMFCRDLKQLVGDIRLPKQDPATEHHALNDARWTRDAFLSVDRRAIHAAARAKAARIAPSALVNTAPVSSPFTVAKGYGICPACGENVAHGAHGSSWRERRPNGNTRCGACGKITPSREWKRE